MESAFCFALLGTEVELMPFGFALVPEDKPSAMSTGDFYLGSTNQGKTPATANLSFVRLVFPFMPQVIPWLLIRTAALLTDNIDRATFLGIIYCFAFRTFPAFKRASFTSAKDLPTMDAGGKVDCAFLTVRASCAHLANLLILCV